VNREKVLPLFDKKEIFLNAEVAGMFGTGGKRFRCSVQSGFLKKFNKTDEVASRPPEPEPI
jgi:hypothetical protein